MFYMMVRPRRYNDDAYAYWWTDDKGVLTDQNIQIAAVFNRTEAALKSSKNPAAVAVPVEVAKKQALILARAEDVMNGLVNHAQRLMTGN